MRRTNDDDREILRRLDPVRTSAALASVAILMILLLCVFCFIEYIYIELSKGFGRAIGDGIEQSLSDRENLTEMIWGVQHPPDLEALYDEDNVRQASRDLQNRLGLSLDFAEVIGDGTQITEELLHGSLSERQAAAYILGEFGEQSASLMPVLIQSLDDPDPAVRRFSAYALGEIGPNSKDALPKLTILTETDGERVRSEAAKAIAKIGD